MLITTKFAVSMTNEWKLAKSLRHSTRTKAVYTLWGFGFIIIPLIIPNKYDKQTHYYQIRYVLWRTPSTKERGKPIRIFWINCETEMASRSFVFCDSCRAGDIMLFRQSVFLEDKQTKAAHVADIRVFISINRDNANPKPFGIQIFKWSSFSHTLFYELSGYFWRSTWKGGGFKFYRYGAQILKNPKRTAHFDDLLHFYLRWPKVPAWPVVHYFKTKMSAYANNLNNQ